MSAGRQPSESGGIARKALQQRYRFIGGYRSYVASLTQAGRIDEARAALVRMKKIQPEVSIAWTKQYVPDPPGPMANYIEGVRKVGLR